MKLSDVRIVRLLWSDDSPATDYFTTVLDMDKMVEATTKLHFNPGFNPHNNCPTSKIDGIDILMFKEHASFWWTNPDLKNENEDGAKLLEFHLIKHIQLAKQPKRKNHD